MKLLDQASYDFLDELVSSEPEKIYGASHADISSMLGGARDYVPYYEEAAERNGCQLSRGDKFENDYLELVAAVSRHSLQDTSDPYVATTIAFEDANVFELCKKLLPRDEAYKWLAIPKNDRKSGEGIAAGKSLHRHFVSLAGCAVQMFFETPNTENGWVYGKLKDGYEPEGVGPLVEFLFTYKNAPFALERACFRNPELSVAVLQVAYDYWKEHPKGYKESIMEMGRYLNRKANVLCFDFMSADELEDVALAALEAAKTRIA